MRIFTAEKERVMPLVNEAKLLDDIGNFQLVFCMLCIRVFLLSVPLEKNEENTLIKEFIQKVL